MQVRPPSITFDLILLLADDFIFLAACHVNPVTSISTEFQDSHNIVLGRFYTLFESIVKYYEDYNKFLSDLRNNFYMQYKVADVMQDVDGKQLMCEAAYLFGCMLLFLDMHIPGYSRERIVVSHYRFKGEAALKDVESVTKLCRSTGYTKTGKRERDYTLPVYDQPFFIVVVVCLLK